MQVFGSSARMLLCGVPDTGPHVILSQSAHGDANLHELDSCARQRTPRTFSHSTRKIIGSRYIYTHHSPTAYSAILIQYACFCLDWARVARAFPLYMYAISEKSSFRRLRLILLYTP